MCVSQRLGSRFLPPRTSRAPSMCVIRPVPVRLTHLSNRFTGQARRPSPNCQDRGWFPERQVPVQACALLLTECECVYTSDTSVQAVKRLNGAKWNPELKGWKIPGRHLADLTNIFPDAVVKEPEYATIKSCPLDPRLIKEVRALDMNV